jgi:hypothetical protein
MFDVSRHIEQLLSLYARALPTNSPTAEAIRRQAPITDIANAAEKEGLHYISSAVFLAQEQQLDKVPDRELSDVVRERIQDIRKHLPDGCETARAIDRKAKWSEVSQSAERDGLNEIVTLIFDAEQQGLED